MNRPFIAPRIQAELRSPAPVGQRHEQAKRIVVSFIAQGLSPDAVFCQLRSMYTRDVTNTEIRNLIAWAVSKNFRPSVGQHIHPRLAQVTAEPQRVTRDEAIAHTESWLKGFRCDEADLWEKSPWRPLSNWKLDSLALLAALYDEHDRINIVTDHTVAHTDGQEKASPKGAGESLLRDEWIRHIRKHGIPQSAAGAWIRPNPVKQTGSGRAGAVTDADVTNYRFALIESDALPAGLQLPLWATLPLPIAAIIASGGRSPHAWVKVDCVSADEYQNQVGFIYSRLIRFGVDPSNKNESRLSRLPGAQRIVGAQRDGAQRLLFLNPEPTGQPIFARQAQ